LVDNNIGFVVPSAPWYWPNPVAQYKGELNLLDLSVPCYVLSLTLPLRQVRGRAHAREEDQYSRSSARENLS